MSAVAAAGGDGGDGGCGGIAEVAATEVGAAGELRSRLVGSLALRVEQAIDPGVAARWAAAVASARSEWVSDFGGSQFSLGRAWYTHL